MAKTIRDILKHYNIGGISPQYKVVHLEDDELLSSISKLILECVGEDVLCVRNEVHNKDYELGMKDGYNVAKAEIRQKINEVMG